MIDLHVVEMGELNLVGVRIQCAGDEYIREIPKGFRQMKDRLAKIPNAISLRLFGVYKPGDFSEEEDGYWVCAEVSEVPQGMVKLSVPPQKYFKISHYGPASEIRNTYDQSHQIMTEKGYERLLRAWHLEIYDMVKNGMEDIVDVDLYNVIR